MESLSFIKVLFFYHVLKYNIIRIYNNLKEQFEPVSDLQKSVYETNTLFSIKRVYKLLKSLGY